MKKRKIARLLSTVMCLTLLFSAFASFSASAAVTVVSVDPLITEWFPASETGEMTYNGTTFDCVGVQHTTYFNLSNGRTSSIFVSLWNGKKSVSGVMTRYAGTYQILDGYSGCVLTKKDAAVKAYASNSSTNIFTSYGPAQELYNTNRVHSLENIFYTTYTVRVAGSADIETNISGVEYFNSGIRTTSGNTYY